MNDYQTIKFLPGGNTIFLHISAIQQLYLTFTRQVMSQFNYINHINHLDESDVSEGPKGLMFTSSQNKLKKLTKNITEKCNSQQELYDKISEVRHKLISKELIETSNTNKPKESLQKVNDSRYSNINTIMRTLKTRQRSELSGHRTNPIKNVVNFKNERIHRDKQKNPIKYKIVAQELGIKDQKIYELKNREIFRIQQDYTKRKGLEYLRNGRQSNLRSDEKFKTQPSQLKSRSSSSLKNTPSSLIHHIFNHPHLNIKKSASQKTYKIKNLNHLNTRELKQQQQMLGKLVFQRVKKHLKKDKSGINYFQRVHSQQDIDDALVNFLKVKIERAEARFRK